MRPLVDVETGFLSEALQADVALIRSLAGVGARVYLQVLLAGEGGGTRQALERSALDGVYTFMSAKAGLLSEPLVTDVALIGAHFVDQRLDVLLCVYTFVRVKTGLLRESLQAKIALEGTFASVSTHVHL